MRNLTRSPFQRGAQPRRSIMPANSYAEGGLASIPSYAEGDEVEIEETSTGEDILEFLANFGGVADGPSITDIVEYFSEKREGPSLQDAIDQLALMGGMPKGMSKGGVVPGSNPVQGVKGGPTVGFKGQAAGLAKKYEKNMSLFNSLLGDHYKDLGHYQQSRGHSLNPLGDDFFVNVLVENDRLNAQKQTAPPPQESKPSPTLPQTFTDLETSEAVKNPAVYVAGEFDDMDQLFGVYHPGSVSESEDPDYAAQAAALYAGGTPTGGLGLSSADNF